MAKYIVGAVRDTPAGTKRIVTVNDITIALFNVRGKFYAVLNRCPHQGGPLGKGYVVGKLESTRPGQYDLDLDESFVKCAWHGWEFELASGKSWWDPARTRVRAYRVAVEHGGELLAQAGADGRVPGPYVATTFPVSIEDDYVVVEVGK
jgi:nitrite reductase/ring-hydroxylating ferredoxin subunit